MADGWARETADRATFYADLARKEIAALSRRVEVLERLLADAMQIAAAQERCPPTHTGKEQAMVTDPHDGQQGAQSPE